MDSDLRDVAQISEKWVLCVPSFKMTWVSLSLNVMLISLSGFLFVNLRDTNVHLQYNSLRKKKPVVCQVPC